MSLYSEFINNKDRVIHKWLHYFPIYERFFNSFQNKSILFIEIGVYKGGSLRMWEKYFGPFATIVGLDINPDCKKYESENVHVRIGDQKDRNFLNKILDEFGNPDIVLDDGSHMQEDIWLSFETLYPELKNNGVYFIEDLHTAYWPKYGGGLGLPDNFIEKSKRLIDQLNAYHYIQEDSIPAFSRNTFSISYFDSVVVFEKMEHKKPLSLKIGNRDI